MQTLYILGASHAIFGAALLLTKRPRHISDVLLAVWILLIGAMLAAMLSETPVITYFKPGLFPVFLCFGPFLYLYIQSLTIESYRFTRSDLWHFVPFLLVVVHRSITDPVNMGPEGGLDFREPGQLSNFVYFSMATVSISIYSYFAFRQIRKHKDGLIHMYSYRSSRITLTWLRLITYLFLLNFTLSFVLGYFNILFPGSRYPFQLQMVGNFIFIVLASFFGVNQPVILAQERPPGAGTKKETEQRTQEQKYTRSGLSDTDLDLINEKLQEYLEREKPFLDPEYSIAAMATALKLPRHHLTQVINTRLKKNFYTLINELRVEEVKLRMSDEAYANLTMLAIAYDSGFNSKSAFNRVFKQITGKTPSEYKTELITSG